MTAFTHTLTEVDLDYITFNTDALPPAIVQMSVHENGDFSLIANQAGYLHLARVFAELGLRKFPSGCHFHKDGSFRFHTGGAEFTFGLVGDESVEQ